MQFNAGYERIGRCVKHADAVRERKPSPKQRPKNPKLKPRKNKLQRLIQFELKHSFASYMRLVLGITEKSKDVGPAINSGRHGKDGKGVFFSNEEQRR